MKKIIWLLRLAEGKPLIFSLAILLIAVSTLAIVVKNRDGKIDECNSEKKLLQSYYEARFDSLTIYYRNKENQLNEEVKETLNSIIADYREQLEEQKSINRKINTTISNTKRIIRKSKTQLKNLQQ